MTMKKEPLVVIIIPNWNGRRLLEKCLSSLYRLTAYNNFKVIVVDNGSSDGSVQEIRGKFPQADMVSLEANYGFSKGCNEGIRYAVQKYSPVYFLLLNNDIEIIQKDWLSQMIVCAERSDTIAVVGCKLLYPDGTLQHAGVVWRGSLLIDRGWGEKDHGQYDESKEMVSVSGASFLVKRKVINRIGVLDEIYSPFQSEESDFCFRARKHGYKIIYCGKSKLIHHENASIKKTDNVKRFYIGKRNWFIFILRWFDEMPKETFIIDQTINFASCFVYRQRSKYEKGRITIKPNFPLLVAAFLLAFIAALFKFKTTRYKL